MSALQWTGSNKQEVRAFAVGASVVFDDHNVIHVACGQRRYLALPGDWFIRTEAGNLRVCVSSCCASEVEACHA